MSVEAGLAVRHHRGLHAFEPVLGCPECHPVVDPSTCDHSGGLLEIESCQAIRRRRGDWARYTTEGTYFLAFKDAQEWTWEHTAGIETHYECVVCGTTIELPDDFEGDAN